MNRVVALCALLLTATQVFAEKPLLPVQPATGQATERRVLEVLELGRMPDAWGTVGQSIEVADDGQGGYEFVFGDAGVGDVTKVGTPADNQVGVWTGDGTIEGTSAVTYDGSTFDVTGAITASTYVSAPSIQITGGTGDQGTFVWDDTEQTVSLSLGSVSHTIGRARQMLVRNDTADIILKGTPVMKGGEIGASGKVTVHPMDGTDQANAQCYLGITAEDIAVGADGNIITEGELEGLDTSAWPVNTVLWISPTAPGELVGAEPAADAIGVVAALVVTSHSNQGKLCIRTVPLNTHAFATYAQGTAADAAIQPGDIDSLAGLNSLIADATLIDTADSRLSDARPPTVHASTHASAGADPITPAAIGALQDVVNDITPQLGGTLDLNSNNITGANGEYVAVDQIRAYDASGLKLTDDGGNGIFVADGGRVGIGTETESPIGKLDVHSGDSGRDTANVSGDDLVVQNNGNAGISILTPSANTGYLMFGDETNDYNGLIGYDQSTDTMRFNVSQADRMTISGTSVYIASSVGIGAAPTKKLTISASGFDARVSLNGEGTLGTAFPGLEFKHNGSESVRALIRSDYDDPGANLTFWTSNGYSPAKAVSIDKLGNVGIDSPTSPTLLSLGDVSYTFAASGLSFGDGDTGHYEIADDEFATRIGGTDVATWSSVGLSTTLPITYTQQSFDPAEPAVGKCITWASDGTGKGDAGDFLIACNVGGTTTWVTLFDASSGAAW